MKTREEEMKKGRKSIQDGKTSIVRIILLNIAVIFLILLIANMNFLVFPNDKMNTRNNIVRFEWIGLSNVKVDDNPQFTSPIEITKSNPVAELKPGEYYWKAGLSGVRSFVIDSEVGISVSPESEGNKTSYRIENKGNTRILLNVIGLITGRVILEPNAITYQENVSEIEKIEASENERK